MNKFDLDQLKSIYTDYWKPGWGSIAGDEVLFVQDLIEKYRPDDFLEIGMASGLSGGLITQMLEWSNGKSFTTIDYDNTFFGDPSKPNGFLLDDIYKGSAVVVEKKPFTMSIDIQNLNKTFDMAFIDANHQQPWPIIDTLCLFPFMTGSKVIIHHDLRLFKTQDVVYGIGPKYLHDQVPEKFRLNSSANEGNIFAFLFRDMTNDQLEELAINTFCLPWSLRSPLSDDMIERLSAFFEEHYSQKLAKTFLMCTNRFNNLERLRTGV